jgi:hypothetical protein
LKGVKADTHRKNDVQVAGDKGGAQKGKSEGEAFSEKIVILKDAKEAEINGNAYKKQGLSKCTVLTFTKLQGNFVVHRRAKEYKAKESPIPPAIKDITGYNNKQVLRFETIMGDKPVQDKNNG